MTTNHLPGGYPTSEAILSVAFKPEPVSTIATVSPAAMSPELIRRVSAAPDDADVGSTNNPWPRH